MERKPGRDGARLRRDVRAQAPSEMPRGYATAGARVGDALAAQRDDANIGAIDKPTTRRLLRTSNANTVVAVARCKCIEDVTTFITRIELLDRINLLSATVTAPSPLACVGRHPMHETRPVAEESLPHLPKPPGRRRKIGKCRAVLVLIFGKMLLVDLLDGYTKQR